MSDSERRAANRSAMEEILRRLGSQDFEGACSLLDEDVHCDWPYPPMRDSAPVIQGRAAVEKFFREGMSAFDPYRYEITAVFELLDPDCLIAEYHSNSKLLASGAPYRNDYLGIFRFRGGKVSHWREYINPVVVAEVLATLGETS